MRYWFGASLADWAFSTGDGGVVVLAPGAVVTLWNASTGGTRYTDLLNAAGEPISAVVTGDGTTGPAGVVPRFQGPEGVRGVWADAGGGVRAWMPADLSDEIGALNDRVTALETQLAAAQERLKYALLALRYDAAKGYPALPAALAASEPYLLFIGPEIPTGARRRDLHIHTAE